MSYTIILTAVTVKFNRVRRGERLDNLISPIGQRHEDPLLRG